MAGEPARGEASGLDFCYIFRNDKADRSYPLPFAHSCLCQFQLMVWATCYLTENCSWRPFQKAFLASELQQLVRLAEGVFGTERVNWTLNLSHITKQKKKEKEKDNTTEYLHNRLYLQFLGRKEKEKDISNIWDKTSGKQKTGLEDRVLMPDVKRGHTEEDKGSKNICLTSLGKLAFIQKHKTTLKCKESHIEQLLLLSSIKLNTGE